jgi:hypothetical protein
VVISNQTFHRIHMGIEFGARLRVHVTRADGDRADVELMAGPGHVDRIFVEHDRIVVGEGNARTTKITCGTGNGLRVGAIGQHVVLASFADVPILAKPAGKIAARGPE